MFDLPIPTEPNSTDEFVVFNLHIQLDLILSVYKPMIIQYRQELVSAGDVISLAPTLASDILNLHLLISADGANPYFKKKSSFWPLQATLLDLPNNVRSRIENSLFLVICRCTGKPNWDSLMPSIFKKFRFRQEVNLPSGLTVIIHPYAAVFDLPAQAHFLNVTQFNGEFGCLFCKHPGRRVESGRGKAQVYPYEPAVLITSIEFSSIALLASKSNSIRQVKKPIFGIKGQCSLTDYISVPDNILIDGMHLLYENITSTLLSSFFDPKCRTKPFFLGRRVNTHYFKTCLQTISLPHDFSRSPPLTDLKMWKAHDFKNMLAYYSVPLLLFHLPQGHCIHFMSLIMSCHFANNVNSRNLIDKLEICVRYFYSHMSFFYPSNFVTINVHLLSHIPRQFSKFGALSYSSMFSFESKNHLMKTYMKGTKGHLLQICSKIALVKSYINNANLSPTLLTKLKNVINLTSVSYNQTQILDPHRVIINNQCYHSLQYNKRCSSVSYIVQYCEHSYFKYGKILSFLHGEVSIANVSVLKPVNTVIDLFNFVDLSPAEMIICSYISESFISVMETEEVHSIPIASFITRCLLFPVPNKVNLHIVVPIISLFEHD